MFKLAYSYFALALGFFPSLAAAAVVVMENGDRLTGDLIAIEEGQLRVRVEYAGELTIPMDRIKNVDELALIMEKPKTTSSAQTAATATPASAKVVSAKVEPTTKSAPKQDQKEPAAQKDTADPASSRYAHYLESLKIFPAWNKRLQMGMTSQSGRKNKTDVNYHYTMQRKAEKNQYRFNAEYVYGKAGTNTTSNKFATEFRWRQDLSPGVFYQSNTSYGSDEIKRIDVNLEQKFGLGTRFLENDAMTLSSGLGASGRWRDFATDDEQEVTYLVDLFQDWDYRINERLRLRQDLRFAVPLEDRNEYEYNFTAALVSELTKTLDLSLRYELGYDNSLSSDVKSDRRFISTLGYKF